MQPHKVTLAVTGMDTGAHKFFHIERGEIQTLADRFEGGTDRARMVLQEMLLHGTGLPADPILDCAAACLFTTSSGWEARSRL